MIEHGMLEDGMLHVGQQVCDRGDDGEEWKKNGNMDGCMESDGMNYLVEPAGLETGPSPENDVDVGGNVKVEDCDRGDVDGCMESEGMKYLVEPAGLVGKSGPSPENDVDVKVEDTDTRDRRETVEVLRKNTKQGSIKFYTTNVAPFGALKTKSMGGANGGGENERLSGVKDVTKDQKSDRPRSNIRKTWGFKKMGGNKKNKGAKSKAGKEPAGGRSDSSQGIIGDYFRSLTRPEETWNSPGNSQTCINTNL